MEKAIGHHHQRSGTDGDEEQVNIGRPLVLESAKISGHESGADRLMASVGSSAPPPSPPESDCSSDADDADDDDDMERAGYDYCAREAIRFLVDEERLDADHPMVRQLRRLFDAVAAASGARAGAPPLAHQQ